MCWFLLVRRINAGRSTKNGQESEFLSIPRWGGDRTCGVYIQSGQVSPMRACFLGSRTVYIATECVCE